MRTLVEAMGRLALGELHDLPDLPPPSGTPVDALAKGIIQVRTRLLNLQGAIQHYQTEQQQLQQELAALRKQVDLEMQGEQQLLMQMNQDLEEQLKTERQVAQVAEEQLQKERLSAQARIQAAEARAQEAEATLAAAEERLRLDYEALERRMKTERQELEERLRAAPQTDLTRATRLRQQSEEFTSAFSEQSERLYTSAAALQTAAEVARRIARSIQETAALPGLRSAEAPAPAPAPAASSPGPQTLSAMQLLEQLAGIRQTESAPLTPPPTSGALPGTASHEIIKRLNTVASRAEEMAGGLQDLSSELVKEGDTSKEAAEKAELLKTELEHLAQTTPATLRAKLPVRSSRNERP
jgi:methyl-accepting chemotaxis protein